MRKPVRWLQRASKREAVGSELDGRRRSGRVGSGTGQWFDEQPRVSEHVASKLVGSLTETRNAREKATWGEENIRPSRMTLKLRCRLGIGASVQRNMRPAGLCVALKIYGRLAHWKARDTNEAQARAQVFWESISFLCSWPQTTPLAHQPPAETGAHQRCRKVWGRGRGEQPESCVQAAPGCCAAGAPL